MISGLHQKNQIHHLDHNFIQSKILQTMKLLCACVGVGDESFCNGNTRQFYESIHKIWERKLCLIHLTKNYKQKNTIFI